VPEYATDIKSSARRELENLDDSVIARLVPKIEDLAANPRPYGCRKLRGYEDLLRIAATNLRTGLRLANATNR
jgi:mRNA-degrading endonuclease RelE of RelBE toxin-antitoxin system